MSLDQLLSGAPENTEVEEPVTPAEPAQEPTEPAAPETPAPGTEAPAAPAAMPAAKSPETMPYAAYKAEKDKRQELEAKLASQAKPPEQKPGFWEQPEEHLNRVSQEAQFQALAVKMDLTEDMARAKYADFDEKFETFKALVASHPDLRSQLLQARNPAEFMYSTAKNHAELQAAGSVEGLREKMKAQIRAEVEAEYKAKAEADQKKRDALPNTLTDVQSAVNTRVEDPEDDTLASLLK